MIDQDKRITFPSRREAERFLSALGIFERKSRGGAFRPRYYVRQAGEFCDPTCMVRKCNDGFAVRCAEIPKIGKIKRHWATLRTLNTIATRLDKKKLGSLPAVPPPESTRIE